MKNIFRFLFVVFCLFTTTNPLHAQWIKSSLPSYVTYVTSTVVSGPNIFAGTYGGVFLSSNNGTSWTEVDSGLTGRAVQTLAVSGTNLFAAIYGAGVYLSTNNGVSWAAIDSGLIDSTFSNVGSLAGSSSTIFAGVGGNSAGTHLGRIYRSVNNGTSWTEVDSGLNPDSLGLTPYAIAVSGSNIYVAAGRDILLSTDNGTSWTQILGFSNYGGVRAIAASGSKIVAGTDNGGVLLSTDNGTSWTAIDSGLVAGVYVLAWSGSSIFAGTEGSDGGRVYLLTNHGTRWDTLDTGLRTSSVGSLAINGGYLFAGAYGAEVFPGDQGAGVWKRSISEILASVPPSAIFSQSSMAFGTVHDNSTKSVALSITNGSSQTLVIDSVYTSTRWFTVPARQDTVTSADTLSLIVSFSPDTLKAYTDTLYILSNSSIPLTKIPLSGNGSITAVFENNSDIPKSYGMLQNYPNPFNPSSTIRYGLPERSRVRLMVYNLLGQIVADLVNTEQAAGWNQVVWNANVASGLYFYRMEAVSVSDPNKRFVDVKKMILLK